MATMKEIYKTAKKYFKDTYSAERYEEFLYDYELWEEELNKEDLYIKIAGEYAKDVYEDVLLTCHNFYEEEDEDYGSHFIFDEWRDDIAETEYSLSSLEEILPPKFSGERVDFTSACDELIWYEIEHLRKSMNKYQRQYERFKTQLALVEKEKSSIIDKVEPFHWEVMRSYK